VSERLIVTGGRRFGYAARDEFPRRKRRAATERQYVEGALENALTPRAIVVVGDCPTGVDAIVRDYARKHNRDLEVFCADWKRHGRKAGPIRNGEMVRATVAEGGAVRCLAFPGGNGTSDCIRQAKAAGVSVVDLST
jgi:hypothetical protein